MDLFKFLKKEKQVSFEALLKDAATKPAYRIEFYKRILSEKLVVITQEKAGFDGYRQLDKDTTVSIWNFGDGRIPVFTSPERIFDKNIVKEQVAFLEMVGRDLFELIKGNTLVLNPYSDHGKEILPGEIENLLNGTILNGNAHHIEIKKETQLQIGQPAVYPTEIVNSLKTLFKQKPKVNAAYLAWIYDPASGEPAHYIFAIDTDEDWALIGAETGFVAKQSLRSGEIFDLIKLEGRGGIENYFVNDTTPFYKR